MSRLKFLLAAIGLTLSVGAANATTFNWTETGLGGSGTFVATLFGSGEYHVISVTGTIYDSAITGLIAPGDYCIAGGACNDNDLFFPPQSGGELDLGGIAFLTASAENVGLEFGFFSFPSYDYSLNTELLNIGDGFSATPVITPLPAALPLFVTGLGGLGLLGWRRKRKNTAAIAAA
jgi:hypothetical protein